MKKTLQYKFAAFFKLLSWGLILRSLLITAPCNAQTGPGGVETTNGNSNLILWLKADSSVTGDPVSSWSDLSGKGYDATATGGNQPDFQANQINGFPVLRFDGTSDELGIADNNDMNTPTVNQTERTFMMVFRTSANLSGRQMLYEEGGNTNGLNIYLSDDTLFVNAYVEQTPVWGPAYVDTVNIQTNTTYLVTFTFHSTNGVEGFLNGASFGIDNSSIGEMLSHSGDIGIGGILNNGQYHDGSEVGSGDNFEGDIAEFIQFSKALNDVERTIIENALAAKYGLTIPDDKYSFQASFNVDVVGVGQETAVSQDSVFSYQVGVVNPSLSNGDFLLFGHNNASFSFSSSDVPTGVLDRIERSWAADTTGNTGPVTVRIDAAAYSTAPSQKFVLLVDDDGTFNDASVSSYDTSYTSGDTLVFNNIVLGDSVFTLGRVGTASKPNSVVYSPSTLTLTSGSIDSSNVPTIDDGGAALDSIVISDIYKDGSGYYGGGISIDTLTGKLYTDGSLTPGVYDIDVRAYNSVGDSVFAEAFSFTITSQVTALSYSNYSQTMSYGQSIQTATPNVTLSAGTSVLGVLSYAWDLTPTGTLILNADGTITGAPTTSGVYEGTVTVTGSGVYSGEASATVQLAFFDEYGPGGVGDTLNRDGLVVWLKADEGVSTSGTDVTAWTDKSGRSNDGDPEASTPTFVSSNSAMNNQPTIQFDGSSDYISIANNADINDGGEPYLARTITITFKADNVTTSPQVLYEDGGGTRGFSVYLKNDALYVNAWNDASDDASDPTPTTPWGSVYFDTTGLSAGVPYVVTLKYSHSDATNGELVGYLNGKSFGSGTNVGRMYDHTGNIGLGALVNGTRFENTSDNTTTSGSFFDGDIGEMMIYNAALSDAHRLIVENYLGAKYGAAQETDLYQLSSNTQDVSGLGQASDGSQHLSAKSDRLKFKDDDFTSGEFLLFGHDNGSVSGWASSEFINQDSTNSKRMAREWRIDMTGVASYSVDSLVVDLTGFALPSGYDNFAIFMDADGDFTSGASHVDLTSVSGNYYGTDNLSLNDGDFITFGAIKRTVNFSSTSTNVVEGTTPPPSFTIELNWPYPAGGNDVQVDYDFKSGSATLTNDPATGDVDTLSNLGTQTVSAGTTSIEFSPIDSLVNDSDVEVDETVILVLRNAVNASIGNDSLFTLTINDDDNTKKVKFTNLTDTRTETDSGSDTAKIEVSIPTGEGGGGNINVFYSFAGSASGDSLDYKDLNNGQVTISGPAASDTSALINLLLVADTLNEGTEDILVQIDSVQNATVQTGNTTHTITYTDNDTLVAQFASTSESEDEAIRAKDFTVNLDRASVYATDIYFSLSGSGTASSGVDFNLSTSSPLSISAGSTSANISVSIAEDSDIEDDETIIIVIDSVVNASNIDSVGTNNQFTYTILNEDFYGTNGPGGVGDTTGNSDLVLWYKAERSSRTGNTIDTLYDLSGRGIVTAENRDAITSNAPTYITDTLNAMPVVRFDGSANLLEIPNVDDINSYDNTTDGPQNARTIFLVFRPTTTALSGDRVLYEEGGGTNGLNIYMNSTSLYCNVYSTGAVTGETTDEWGTVYTSTAGLSANTSYVLAFKYEYTGDGSNLDGVVVSYLNGSQSNGSSTNVGELYSHTGEIALGDMDAGNSFKNISGANNNGQPFQGDIAEFLQFTSALSDARRIIIENYLGAKFGISLGANDKYAGDNSGNGDYDFDVQGIANLGGSISEVHQSAGNSAGLLIQEISNSLDSAEFVFTGHKSTTNGVTGDDMGLIPGTGQRWQRVWYIDKTGSVDTRLTFDFSDAGISASPGADPNDYILIRRAGQTGDFSQVVTATSISGDQIIFDLADAQLTDGYFTLATTDSDTPLPVELASYTLENLDNAIKLNWKTAAEVDNQGFILERSEQPNQGFEQVASYQSSLNLKGQGTVSQETSYEYVDYGKFKHGETYYYRLSDVDIAGNRNVLETKAITRPDAYSLEQNYPNPFNPVTTITFSLQKPGKTMLEVYNILGQKVKTLLNDELKAGTHIQRWDARGYASGVYFYRLQSGSFTRIKKMMLVK